MDLSIERSTDLSMVRSMVLSMDSVMRGLVGGELAGGAGRGGVEVLL
jgi:hypothetical protein